MDTNHQTPRFRRKTTDLDRRVHHTHQRIIATYDHPLHITHLYNKQASSSLSLAAYRILRITKEMKQIHDANAPTELQFFELKNNALEYTYFQLLLHLPRKLLLDIYKTMYDRPIKNLTYKHFRSTWRDINPSSCPDQFSFYTPLRITDATKLAAHQLWQKELESAITDDDRQKIYEPQIRELIKMQQQLPFIGKLTLDFDGLGLNTIGKQSLNPEGFNAAGMLLGMLRELHNTFTTTIQRLNPHSYLLRGIPAFNVKPPHPLKYRPTQPDDDLPNTPTTASGNKQRQAERIEWYKRRAMDPYRRNRA